MTAIDHESVRAALLRVPGVSAAAVLPAGEGDGGRLVGFYVSEDELSSVDLHDLLSARLPPHLVPAHHIRVPDLRAGPGDRRLRRMAAELATGRGPFEPPGSPTEQRLATAWAEVLGMTAGRVGRNDDFFLIGGTSLAAIHLVIRLGHRLSLSEMLCNPVLREQARLLDTAGAVALPPLLQPLGSSRSAGPSLVCFPDAGGNAVNFQHLARSAGGRLNVLAVEPPGHDLARLGETLLALPQLARRLVRELAGTPAPYLWGQGAGAAAALATARALERAGTPAAGVLLAWDGTAPVGVPAAMISDDEVAERLLRRRAYVEVDTAVPDRLAFVARAYRHDVAEALRELDRPHRDHPSLTCPVTEFTFGSARPCPLAGCAGLPCLDVARHRPELILELIERWHDRATVPA